MNDDISKARREADELRNNATNAARQAQDAQRRVESLEKSCSHVWDEVRYTPDYKEGYYIPSDIEQGINLGVDTRVSGVHVPSSTTKKWSRTCRKCGKTETTTSVKKQFISGKIAGTGGEVEVPNFGDERRW